MEQDDNIEQSAERPSKSQLKRDSEMLHKLVQQLVALPAASLSRLSLSEKLQEGIAQAKKLKRIALKRQLKYLTGLMREVDSDAIVLQLERLIQPHRQQVQQFHEVEQWRDALLAGDEALLEELVSRFETADRQHLRQLVRNAQKERDQNKPPKSARLLFSYLSDLQSNQ
jgi:ribosome-associated protein